MFLTIVVDDVVRVLPKDFIGGCSAFALSANVKKGSRRLAEQASRSIAAIANSRGRDKSSEADAQRVDDLNDPVLALIFRTLTEKHAGNVVHGQGICLCVYEILEMGKWKLIGGEGAAVSIEKDRHAGRVRCTLASMLPSSILTYYHHIYTTRC